jgi:dTDP-4-dehydrorhamnose reductase
LGYQNEQIALHKKNMTNILVTGANGQLGSEIRKIARNYNQFSFAYTDIGELDICNYQELEKYFEKKHADYIINCAAYTAVDKAESDVDTARKVNIDAVANLSAITLKYKSKLIHGSTDYVFDSVLQNLPFKETDLTGAKSVYGSTKLLGEEEAKKANNFLIIRTSWLYSGFGNNFVKTILRLGSERKEIGVIYDQIGTPCYAEDLASAILTIINDSESTGIFKSGIYHYSNEGVCSWYDFAVEIIKMSGLNCKVNPIETKDYPLPAKRPAYSVLNKSKIKETFGLEIPHWRDSLQKCMNEISKKV